MKITTWLIDGIKDLIDIFKSKKKEKIYVHNYIHWDDDRLILLKEVKGK